MKIVAALVLLLPCFSIFATDVLNPTIDMPGYLRVSADAAEHRQSRRLTEEEFLAMSRKAGTVVLDARSRDKFDELHVEGAINLPFSDIAVRTLAEILPDKGAPILIYCNNNFINNERAFAEKKASASLNLATYIALFNYEYRNVYELGPLLDVRTTKLKLVSTE